MKVAQLKEVIKSVQANVALTRMSDGKAMIVGLENFSDEMLTKFDQLYDAEMSRIIAVEGKGEVQ